MKFSLDYDTSNLIPTRKDFITPEKISIFENAFRTSRHSRRSKTYMARRIGRAINRYHNSDFSYNMLKSVAGSLMESADLIEDPKAPFATGILNHGWEPIGQGWHPWLRKLQMLIDPSNRADTPSPETMLNSEGAVIPIIGSWAGGLKEFTWHHGAGPHLNVLMAPDNSSVTLTILDTPYPDYTLTVQAFTESFFEVTFRWRNYAREISEDLAIEDFIFVARNYDEKMTFSRRPDNRFTLRFTPLDY